MIVRKIKDRKGRKEKENENLIQKKNYLVIGLYLVTHKISIFCSNWGFFFNLIIIVFSLFIYFFSVSSKNYAVYSIMHISSCN